MTVCLYIASPSYSGSTLLTMLLANHHQIATIGEMKGGQEDLATYRCSCGALFAECPFWRELIARLREQGFRFDLSDRRTMPAFQAPFSRLANVIVRRPYGSWWFEAARDGVIALWPRLRRDLAHLSRYNAAFIEEVRSLRGAGVFVDSSKDPLRIKYLSRIPSLDVRVVHLIRDGRAVVNSTRKNTADSAEVAAAEWRDSHLEIERVARRCCGGRLLRVRYEDLCREPAAELRRILDFASVSEPLRAETVDGTPLHVLGNRMRLRGRQAISVDESWRTELPAPDQDVFERIGGALNRRYGYESVDRSSSASAAGRTREAAGS